MVNKVIVMERVHLLHPDVHINATLWSLVQDKAKQLGISTDAIVQHALAREVSTMQ